MEMNKKFEFLDNVADLEFVSYGKTLDECFENSAAAFFSAILNPDSVEIKEKRKIKLYAVGLENLLHDFLNELLLLFEVGFLVFKEFKVKIKKSSGEKYELTAEVSGEELNLKKHAIEAEIKAITYHNMSVEKKNDLWSARVLCDI